MKIPIDLKEFFYWLKDRTESRWAVGPQTDEDECGWDIHESFYGAKWTDGLTPDEIDDIEKEFQIKFPPDYRLFLEILHTVDRQQVIEFYDDDELQRYEQPLFYNWKNQKSEIRRRLNWPIETILQDVFRVNKVWLKSWGPRPEDKGEFQQKRFQAF